jgi:hypothetical protein
MNLWIIGQSGSSRLHVQSVWFLCTQLFPAFLQEDVFRTWTHNLMVTRQQLYHCVRTALLKDDGLFMDIIAFKTIIVWLNHPYQRIVFKDQLIQ